LVNVAVAVTLAVTVNVQIGFVLPGHTPDQETKEAPSNGTALREILWFAEKFRGPGGLTLPSPTLTTITVNCWKNPAVAEVFAVI
jgi:hypothetical protein